MGARRGSGDSARASDGRLALRVRGELSGLSRVRSAVLRFVHAQGVANLDAYRIMSAVDEACSNAVRHAHGIRAHPVDLRVERRGPLLEIRVRDHGPGFDPESIPAPNLRKYVERGQAGGLGLHFLRQVMDRVTYRRDPANGNELRLVKRVHLVGRGGRST